MKVKSPCTLLRPAEVLHDLPARNTTHAISRWRTIVASGLALAFFALGIQPATADNLSSQFAATHSRPGVDRLFFLDSAQQLWAKEGASTSSYVLLARDVDQYDSDGDRVAILRGTTLAIKENELDSGWTILTEHAAEFDLEAGRIGFVHVSNHMLYVKEQIHGHFTKVANAGDQWQLEGDRIGVRTGGRFRIKSGPIDSAWITVTNSARRFLLEDDLVGIEWNRGDHLFVKQGSPQAPFKYVGRAYEDWTIAGSRVAKRASDGRLWVRENLDAPWTLLTDSAATFWLEGNRVVFAHEQTGDIYGKVGMLTSPWLKLSEEGKVFMNGSRLAMLSDTQVFYKDDATMTDTWRLMASNAVDVQMTTRAATIHVTVPTNPSNASGTTQTIALTTPEGIDLAMSLTATYGPPSVLSIDDWLGLGCATQSWVPQTKWVLVFGGICTLVGAHHTYTGLSNPNVEDQLAGALELACLPSILASTASVGGVLYLAGCSSYSLGNFIGAVDELERERQIDGCWPNCGNLDWIRVIIPFW